jgi:hypothetical protein
MKTLSAAGPAEIISVSWPPAGLPRCEPYHLAAIGYPTKVAATAPWVAISRDAHLGARATGKTVTVKRTPDPQATRDHFAE